MRQFFVIKTGETFPDLLPAGGDFEDRIIRGLGLDPADVVVVNAEKGEALPDPGGVSGAVITGSHAMVTDNLPWSMTLEAWVRDMVESRVPLLGICFGHQILTRAMGGTVDFHPKGAEVGTTRIRCLGAAQTDPLFRDMPERFFAHVVHSQSAICLPEGAVLLAASDYEPHEAFRIGKAAWGVQFHPEADMAMTKGYARHLECSDSVLETIRETPHAAALLKRFAAIVHKGEI